MYKKVDYYFKFLIDIKSNNNCHIITIVHNYKMKGNREIYFEILNKVMSILELSNNVQPIKTDFKI